MNIFEIKQKYKIEIDLLFNADRTKKSYISAINKYLFDNDYVYNMSENDIKKYFAKFRIDYSDSYFNVIGSAVKILYERILNQHRKMLWFKPVKTYRQFHDIITENEFKYMMKYAGNIKNKLIIIMFYSTGIRIGEFLNIKLQDIDLINQRIHIKTEKKGKNRFVQVHDITLKYFNVYLKKWKPKKYLLESYNEKYSASSIRSIINRASKGLSKNIYPHLFRHTYLTNLIERENVFYAMEIAGHNSLKSTLHYNHIPIDKLKTMYNPLNSIRT